jgi:NAD(P)H dehydrogenase (quinone)
MTNDDRLFLVAGATGKTGGGAVGLLLERGHRVRALVHREDERSRRLTEAGAEVVVSDLHDLDGMTAAVQGVTGAYFCHPILPGLIEATTCFAQAATEAGVRSVVNMSQISARRGAGSNAARQHWLCERLLDRTNLLTAHIRPTFFAEWLKLWWERRDGEGYLRLPFGEGRHAPIASVDQSRVIAALLLDPEPHDRATYTLHGPVELNHHEIARAMSTTLGIPVRYEPISVEEFAAAMTERGLPAHLVQHLSNVAVDYQNGVFAGTNANVERIGHRAPLSVEQFVLDNKSDFDTSGPNFAPAAGSHAVE